MPLVHHFAWGRPVPYTVERLPDDSDAATAVTVRRMAEYAVRDSRSAVVRSAAEVCLRSRPQDTADAVFHFVRRRLRFVRDAALADPLSDDSLVRDVDPEAREVLVPPADLLSMPEGMGDCDDHTMLGAALLLACRLPVRFVTVAAHPERPDEYSHVYIETDIGGGRWYPLDISHGPAPGYAVEDRFGKLAVWEVGSVRGLNGVGQVPWWQDALSSSIRTAQTILTSRYAHAPEGTVIQRPDFTYVRGTESTGAAPVVGYSPPLGPSLNVGSGTVLLLGGLALAAVVLLGGRRG